MQLTDLVDVYGLQWTKLSDGITHEQPCTLLSSKSAQDKTRQARRVTYFKTGSWEHLFVGLCAHGKGCKSHEMRLHGSKHGQVAPNTWPTCSLLKTALNTLQRGRKQNWPLTNLKPALHK